MRRINKMLPFGVLNVENENHILLLLYVKISTVLLHCDDDALIRQAYM